MRRKIRLKVLRRELCAKHAVRSEQGVVIVKSITPWSKMVLYFRVSHKWEVWIWSSGCSKDGDVYVALLKFLAIYWKRICLCAHNWKVGILSSRYLWLWYPLQVVPFFWYSGKVVSMLKILKMIILFLLAPHAYLIASANQKFLN